MYGGVARSRGGPGNLAGSIDALTETLATTQGPEADDGPAVVEERILAGVVRQVGVTCNLSRGINAETDTGKETAQCAEVGHAASVIQESAVQAGLVEGEPGNV